METALAHSEVRGSFLQGFRLLVHLRLSEKSKHRWPAWRIPLGLRFAGCAGFAPPNLLGVVIAAALQPAGSR